MDQSKIQYQEWTSIDKSKWIDGPWITEPDKIQFVTKVGFPGVVLRNPAFGNLCGYVGVTKGHQLFQVQYSSCPIGLCDEVYCEHSPAGFLKAHGGITFSGWSDDRPIDQGLNVQLIDGTIISEGRTNRVNQQSIWWFGFDCGHAGDFAPAMTMPMPGNLFHASGYKDVNYVINQCQDLAQQLFDGKFEAEKPKERDNLLDFRIVN